MQPARRKHGDQGQLQQKPRLCRESATKAAPAGSGIPNTAQAESKVRSCDPSSGYEEVDTMRNQNLHFLLSVSLLKTPNGQPRGGLPLCYAICVADP